VDNASRSIEEKNIKMLEIDFQYHYSPYRADRESVSKRKRDVYEFREIEDEAMAGLADVCANGLSFQ